MDTKITPRKVSLSFAAALSYFLKNKPKKYITQKYIGKKVGHSQSYIGKLAKGEREGHEETRRKIAAVYGYDGLEGKKTYEDFIIFDTEILKEKEKPSEECTKSEHEKDIMFHVILTEHKSLVEKFQNKELAYEINQTLLKIEQVDPERLEEIKEYIDLVYNRLSKKNDMANSA